MSTSFAPLETCGPSSRTFTPGVYATKRFTSINGAGVTRLYGSKAFDAQLQMSFLLNDADTSAFLKCFDDAKGDYDTVILPDEFYAGANSVLDSAIPSYLNWKWAEAPQVESLLPGRSRVQAKFTATLDS